ncbi:MULTISPECIES: inorganic phosphate transporter [Actinomyces]|uniref:Inorganic phosphate transporter n=1 Tax=Actinomyces marmotae TaxID=2737173 RepID=A0A6M8AXF4_9ACTO|nr:MULTISPECIES: inorganic phosphate transporter [Actinomyces]QKD79099.1 inorganic phosphate transporter [Actinomyces marmotae]
MMTALVIAILVVALIFNFTNGFHDAANAIATSVSTRALSMRTALVMAAVMNIIGALLGTSVAHTIGSDIVSINYETAEGNTIALIVVFAALFAAIAWNLITWWFGLPSSSSHALIGGLAGGGIACGLLVHWSSIVDKVIVPMVVSPLGGFIVAYVAMIIVLRLCAALPYHRTMRRFRWAQTASAAAMALGHGLQDAQKTMGVMLIALTAGGFHSFDHGVPTWVKITAALTISIGTYFGGTRIMATLGSKVIDLDPAHGFVAESVAAGFLYVAAMGFGAPVSTTHTITTSIMGVGATKRLSAVRWGVAGDIVVAWVMTLPAAAAIAAAVALLLRAVLL